MLQLHEQYDKIYRYCYFKTRNASLAEDLTQESFLRFFSRRDYINRGKPLALLYTIAKNLCVDAFRKTPAQPLPDDVSAPGSGMEQLETSVAVRQALATLPEDAREILLLRYANELSMAEISAVTGLSRFAARRKINGALNKLKGLLRKEDFS